MVAHSGAVTVVTVFQPDYCHDDIVSGRSLRNSSGSLAKLTASRRGTRKVPAAYPQATGGGSRRACRRLFGCGVLARPPNADTDHELRLVHGDIPTAGVVPGCSPKRAIATIEIVMLGLAANRVDKLLARDHVVQHAK
jgi:hypothetical protein